MLSKINSYFSRQKEWHDQEYFDPAWKNRIEQMCRHIDKNDMQVCDFGCGQAWTKQYIPNNLKYYGIDYISRNTETIVCDINKKELPDIEIMNDVIFCSGFIEYIEDTDWFFNSITPHAKKIILSYCGLKEFPKLSLRKKLAWKNHLYTTDIIENILQYGFALTYCDHENKYSILTFEKLA
jgi:hypothetical protein